MNFLTLEARVGNLKLLTALMILARAATLVTQLVMKAFLYRSGRWVRLPGRGVLTKLTRLNPALGHPVVRWPAILATDVPVPTMRLQFLILQVPLARLQLEVLPRLLETASLLLIVLIVVCAFLVIVRF